MNPKIIGIMAEDTLTKNLRQITGEQARRLFVRDISRWTYFTGISMVSAEYFIFRIFEGNASMASDVLDTTIAAVSSVAVAAGLSRLYREVVNYIQHPGEYFRAYHNAMVLPLDEAIDPNEKK